MWCRSYQQIVDVWCRTSPRFYHSQCVVFRPDKQRAAHSWIDTAVGAAGGVVVVLPWHNFFWWSSCSRSFFWAFGAHPSLLCQPNCGATIALPSAHWKENIGQPAVAQTWSWCFCCLLQLCTAHIPPTLVVLPWHNFLMVELLTFFLLSFRSSSISFVPAQLWRHDRSTECPLEGKHWAACSCAQTYIYIHIFHLINRICCFFANGAHEGHLISTTLRPEEWPNDGQEQSWFGSTRSKGNVEPPRGSTYPPRNVPPQPPEIAGLTIKGLAEALVSLNKVGYESINHYFWRGVCKGVGR